ncbi:DUF4268 domain-containing protein [Pseudochryseolinea flava]|uniref:DUF4268 domain-containing protein n=1 Tax=Pseudochryseolinea flava TaxID=2059302 RepID=A0A364Y7L8_9BACT|nr:DUF4268 domain-containing protein [Pseudochryseolinea flava]RAW02893.1 DUF4268 domain-containing protein [Pseudochryseolinea flava]
MFSREETSRIKEEFWTTFGRYMSPVPSVEGNKINWINYHTGLKHVHFRMITESKSALIAITIEHRDLEIQSLFFEQFLELKTLLHATLQEEWHWKLHETTSSEKIISKIYKELNGVSVLNKAQWPELISFFKPRIITLDEFWSDAKYSFDSLR